MSTRLFAPDIHGVGTPDLESLSSYFHRTRILNVASGRQWLKWINSPEPVPDTQLTQNGYAKSRLTIQWLHEHGAPDDVLQLGTNRTPYLKRASFRSGRAWCGSCLIETPGVEKNLWTFPDYTVCHVHGERLHEVCPHCGAGATRPSQVVQKPGVCGHCNHSIRAKGDPCNDPWQVFCSEQLSQWVAAYQDDGLCSSVIHPLVGNDTEASLVMTAALYSAWITGRDLTTGKQVREPGTHLDRSIVSTEVKRLALSRITHSNDGIDQGRTEIASMDRIDQAINSIKNARSTRMRKVLDGLSKPAQTPPDQ